MKRNFFIIFALILFSIPRAFAEVGVGAEGGFVTPVYHKSNSQYTVALTFKSSKLPFVLTPNVQFYSREFCAAGLNVDLWFSDSVIGHSLFRFYYGTGVNVSYFPRKKNDEISQSSGIFVAPRFLAGLNTFLTGVSELYVQIAAEPGIVFDADDGFVFRVNLPVGAGLRFWF